MGSHKHMFVFIPMCLRWGFKHGCTKGTDNQIFNPINLSKRQNELNISGSPGHGAVLVRAQRWSSIKTQYNNYKLAQETRRASFLVLVRNSSSLLITAICLQLCLLAFVKERHQFLFKTTFNVTHSLETYKQILNSKMIKFALYLLCRSNPQKFSRRANTSFYWIIEIYI